MREHKGEAEPCLSHTHTPEFTLVTHCVKALGPWKQSQLRQTDWTPTAQNRTDREQLLVQQVEHVVTEETQEHISCLSAPNQQLCAFVSAVSSFPPFTLGRIIVLNTRLSGQDVSMFPCRWREGGHCCCIRHIWHSMDSEWNCATWGFYSSWSSNSNCWKNPKTLYRKSLFSTRTMQSGMYLLYDL